MNRRFRCVSLTSAAALILPFGVLLTGCGRSGEKPAPATETAPAAPETRAAPAPSAVPSKSPLADTEWQLVEIQSMDDAVGTTRPDDPSLYTMRLNADGTVNMRLNCNRATGTWTSEPSQDPSNGRFEFGPLAGTRALCPPPSLDEQIAAQAQYIRGYLLRDGRLHLSLMADGGIWAFEPLAPPRAAMKPDAKLEAAILDASPDYTRSTVDLEGGVGRARYAFERIDLNGDGVAEVFVYPMGSIFCGTGGCNLLIFTEGKGGYALVDEFPITRLPVIVSSGKSAGWNDIFRKEAGGGAPKTWVEHRFDGQHYAETARRPGDPTPAGTPVLAGEVTFQDGIPLEPRG